MSSWFNTNEDSIRNCFGVAVLRIHYKPDVTDKDLPNVTIWLERFIVQDFTTASVFHVEQKIALNISTLMASISVQKHVIMNENTSDVKALVKVGNNNMQSRKCGHSSCGSHWLYQYSLYNNDTDDEYLTQRVEPEKPVKKCAEPEKPVKKLSNGICIEIKSFTEEVEEQAKEK